MSTFADVFIEIEARNAARVMYQTWGHLEPVLGRVYPCTMIFCQSETGDLVCISSDFGPDLGGSPGLQSEINDFVAEHAQEAGQIYRFAGKYRRTRKGARFRGELEKVKVVADEPQRPD